MTSFGRYRSLFAIASGGMAEVHAALQTAEGGFTKVVAVKVLLPHLADSEHFIDMFLDEARIAVAVDSPHVVRILDLGRDDGGSPYLVMELIVGVTLAHLATDADTAIPRDLAIEILAQAAEGLHDAHEATGADGTPLEIVHRDVSPQNILVGVDGVARISDFGIVQAVHRRTQTSAGQMKGKFEYYSPEQATGKPLDKRTDLFALGIVAWEVIAAKRLFDADDDLALLDQVKTLEIPKLEGAIGDVIARALERDPEARFATAHDFAIALRGARGAAVSRDDIEHYVRATSRERIAALETKLRVAVGDASRPGVDEAATRPDRGSHAPRRAAARDIDRDDHPRVAPMQVPGSRRKPVLLAAFAGLLALSAIITIVAVRSRGGASPSKAPTGMAPERIRTIADRACREWSRALAYFQQPNGAFALEPQREPWGFTTAQQLFPLAESSRACGTPGRAPIKLGLDALARFRKPDGYTGANTRAESPATAWAILAASAAEAFDTANADRAALVLAQRPDGSLRTIPEVADGPANGVTTVLSLWALVELERTSPSPETTAARTRAAGWIRRALVEDLDEPPLRATAGLEEQAAWALARSRALAGGADSGDPELFAKIATDIIDRCTLVDGRCQRQIYENGQTFLVHKPGKRPEFVTLWHPWAMLAAHELSRDATLVTDRVQRDKLAQVAAWGMREIEAAIPSLSAAPGYKLAEYLYVVTALLTPAR